MQHTDHRKVIGQAEQVDFPEINVNGLYARVDTGARTSAIWASHVREEGGRLTVVFFDQQSPHYTGEKVYFDEFEETVVASSTGHMAIRYKTRILVRIGGKKMRAKFTLADRSSQVYPVLIGRNVLRGKFIVDVKQGKVLRKEQQARTEQLRSYLQQLKDVKE